MVKFGGHVEAYRAADNRQTRLYLVDYNQIKSFLFEEESTSKFVAAWNEALSASEDDYRAARKRLWDHVFQTIVDHEDSRGANPGVALNVYAETAQPEKAREILRQMEQLHQTATVNTESLRKLVKKHDKYCTEKVSHKLLPILYTSSLYASQNMLHDGIGLVREILDESDSSAFIAPMMRQDSDAHHKLAVAVRMEELDWLKRLVASIPADTLLPRLVAHRGFHHIHDRNDKRPLENSLSAYEVAWTSGIHLCECDIAMTKDGKLVLAHDENFLRLALDSKNDNSRKYISDLTFRELISIPLKNGVRPPLLIDVLRSACAISESSKLIIEIKPGNESVASALSRLLIRHSDLRQAVAMIMSFDAVTMHRLRSELAGAANNPNWGTMSPTEADARHHRVTSFDHFGTMGFASHRRLSSLERISTTPGSIGLSLSQTQFDSAPTFDHELVDTDQNPLPLYEGGSMPKLMLLTVADEPLRLCEQRVSISDLTPVESWLTMADGSLDGVYLQFEKKMMTEAGAAALSQFSEQHLVGIWSYSGKDPDDYNTFEWLTTKGNCTFVNSDLPNHFRKEIFVRTSS